MTVLSGCRVAKIQRTIAGGPGPRGDSNALQRISERWQIARDNVWNRDIQPSYFMAPPGAATAVNKNSRKQGVFGIFQQLAR